jgi:hypothetical protein
MFWQHQCVLPVLEVYFMQTFAVEHLLRVSGLFASALHISPSRPSHFADNVAMDCHLEMDLCVASAYIPTLYFSASINRATHVIGDPIW